MRGITLLISLCTLNATVALAADVESARVADARFDAMHYTAGGDGRHGVIVLSGSGGGRDTDRARRIAAMGYEVLSLAYFDRDGSPSVPETLEMIPLEYFEAPKQWLMSRDSTRNDGVILFGFSKGAELALVLASQDPDYQGVVALAPSHVVWQGNPKDWSQIMSSPSSWSLDGQPLPFVPYVSNEEKERLGFNNRHAASLTNEAAVQAALIDVGRIEAPVLLLSGGQDAMWPASSMGAIVCNTVISAGGRCEHVSFEDGDHLLTKHQAEAFAEVEAFLSEVNEAGHVR